VLRHNSALTLRTGQMDLEGLEIRGRQFIDSMIDAPHGSGPQNQSQPGSGGLKNLRKGRGKKLAGWVARTRPLAEPLSPRGPQPVIERLREQLRKTNGPKAPNFAVPRE
jgi:hypothetical protein